MRTRPAWSALALGFAALLGPGGAAVPAQAPAAPEVDDSRDRQIMERFKTVLEKTPRRGTALDRVYGYHVERGTLDALLKSYRDQVAKNPDDGAAWLLLGLFEAQRGMDSAAVEALAKAEKTRPDDALPSYYLGQALVLVGRPDEAVDAFERALVRKPLRTDLLEIFQALGRAHQRARRTDKALEVWTRLEAMFPTDLRVQEQIAATLAEEDQPAKALERYEKLAEKTTDRYRQVQLKLEAAGLKVRLGKGPEALADFEALLGKLDPDSWLAREVRRKVEDVFLRRDDLAGLAAYYDSWIKKTPDDVEAMARLGRTLTQLGKGDEARSWMEKAVKLAPSRRELRMVLIELLRAKGDYVGAAAQFEALHKVDPNDPDVIREWGRLLLSDPSKPEADRKKAAGDVWRLLVKEDSKDAVAIAQAADLFRQANLVDDAIALHKRAIEAAPDAPQYREYLGEYYHHLKRPADALATWRETVAGKLRTAKNLGRLGEVMAGFGYRAEALEPLTEAVKLEGDDLDLRLKRADVLLALDKPKDADAELALAEKLAADQEQLEAVLTRRIKAFQASNTLAAESEALRKTLEAKPDDVKGWTRLALYLEADGKVSDATQAAVRATKADPRSIPAWTALARLQESSGNLGGATEANRALAALDRRARTDYLTAIARLEARLGRRDAALKAGRDLLAAAPGNPEHDQFFAELCFGLGEVDEGLEALRRSVRANPSDPKVMLVLAENLARQFRTEEAIELYWRAFEKSNDIEGKLSVVAALTNQYLQRNQFDRLLARLEREIREQDRVREKTLCLAQAHQASGDFGTARAELEKLLGTNTRDAQLLTQLSVLAESEGDVSTAARYLKQAQDVAPSNEGTARLAMLYVRSGQTSEAEAVWTRIVGDGRDAARTLGAIDSLLTNGKNDTALALTDRLLVKTPGDWELLYRQGVALAASDKLADASRRFKAILDLRLNDDDMGALLKARTKSNNGPSGARVAQRSLNSPFSRREFPLTQRVGSVWQIRRATKLDEEYYYSGSTSWAPDDFGQARMAALAWSLRAARLEKKEEEHLKESYAVADKPGADVRALWDLYYLAAVDQKGTEIHKAALRLAKALPSEPASQWALLQSLGARTAENSSNVVQNPGTIKVDKTPPLPVDQVELVLKCFREILAKRASLVDSTMVTSVATELKRAKRDAEAEEVYRELLKAPSSEPAAMGSALQLAAERGDVDSLVGLVDRYEAERIKSKSPNYGDGTAALAVARAIGVCFEKKRTADAIRLLDHELAMLRRPEAIAARAKSKTFGNPYGSSSRSYITYFVGSKQQNVAPDFPSPNVHFDYGALSVLRTAFENHRKADLATDLISHLKTAVDKAPPAEKLQPGLALGYVQWWNEDKEEALRTLTRISESLPNDVDLKLSLAELQSRQGNNAEALELADSFEPQDQKTTERRELLALRLSVLAGDVPRARKASERLFGIRLDSATQIELAGQMNQLGLHDLSDAVLARARRRAGGAIATLVGLMNQYQRQGKTDPALQIAHQILRQSGGSVRAYTPYYSSDDSARAEAVALLSRSGKLKELTDRAEAQLKTSPNSLQLLQTLADYYQAVGDKEKVKSTYERIVAIRPDDPKLRFQIGLQLQRAGDGPGAVAHFTAAIRKDASLLVQRYWEVQNAFQAANKNEDLVKLLEEIDLRAVRQNYYAVTNMVQNLIQNDRQREMGMRLFRKAWKDLPETRQELLGSLYNEEIWKSPEIFEYARQAVVPTAVNIGRNPWTGVDRITSYGGGGRVYGLVDRLVDAAARQNKLEPLRAEVAEGLAKSPSWLGGKALLALLDLRAGRMEEGRKALETLIKSEPDMPNTARMLIGQALDKLPETLPLQISLYEAAANSNDTSGMVDEFEYGPGRRLVDLYKKAGRMDEARALLVRHGDKDDSRYQYDPDYAAYRRMSQRVSLASTYLSLGFPADAARTYAEALDDSDATQVSASWLSNIEHYRQSAKTGMSRAINGLNPETVSAGLKAMLTPRPGAEKDAPAVDLVLLAHPRELDKAKVASIFVDVLTGAVRSGKPTDETRATLEKLSKERPDDLSVAVAAALLAAAEDKDKGKADRFKAEAERVAAVAEKGRLDPLPPGARPNSRQRLEAQRRLILWLVARECRKRDALRGLGDKLAQEAMEAARRQTDNRWTLAILREAGQDALDRGDRAGAEKMWRDMLGIVTAPAAAKPVKPAAPGPARPKAAAPARTSARLRPGAVRVGLPSRAIRPQIKKMVVVAPASPAAGTTAGVGSLVTVERFEQAAQIAKLAASNGMFDLSFDAMTEALKGGPPIRPVALNQANNRVVVRSSGGNVEIDSVARSIEQHIHELDGVWREKKVDPARVYRTLKLAVMPPTRPNELFLYARPMSLSQFQTARSVGERLVHWSVAAGKAAELKTELEAMKKRPGAGAAPDALLTLLAVAASKQAEANDRIKALRAETAKAPSLATAETVAGVAVAGMEAPEISKEAKGLLEDVAKSYRDSNNEGVYGALMLKLARFELKTGDVEAATRHLNEYETRMLESASRYVGDYSLYRRKELLLEVASEYAKAERLDEALDHFGRYADAPLGSENYGGGSIVPILAQVDAMLAKLPAAERYAKLKRWTLPEANRAVVRISVVLSGRSDRPAAFGPTEGSPDGFGGATIRLIDAARDAGKLDELAAELEPLVAKKVPGAEMVHILVRLSRPADPRLGDWLDARTKKWRDAANVPAAIDAPTPPGGGTPPPPGETLDATELYLTRLAIRRLDSRDAAERLARALVERARKRQQGQFTARLQIDLADLAAVRRGVEPPSADPGLAFWTPSTSTQPWVGSFETRPVWVEAEGTVAHVGGTSLDSLFLNIPLSGEFEISADVYEGGWSEGSLVHQGLVFEPAALGGNSRMWVPGSNEGQVGSALFTRREAYNRLAVRVSPTSVKYLVNDHLFYENKRPTNTFPWFALAAVRERFAGFRDLKIVGKPTIPAKIELLSEDRCDGWASAFGESHPRRFAVEDVQSNDLEDGPGGTRVPVWRVERGELIGNRSIIDREARGDVAEFPALLEYGRPLADGDGISYEFLYEPGVTEVSPSLGRLIFRLDPEAGVKLRWGGAYARFAPNSDANAKPKEVDDPAARRGPAKLPLKPKDWNRLDLAIQGGKVLLKLNGREIYERPLDPETGRLFGLHYLRDRHSARVRSVVLEGNWPKSLPAEFLANPFARSKPDASPAAKLARAEIVGEALLTQAAEPLLKRVRDLPPAEAYAVLSDWVPPSPSHETFRLQGSFSPSDPAPGRGEGRGGELDAPALALVRVAKSLGKLDELAGRIAKAEAKDDDARRGKLALTAVVAQARGKTAEASAALAALAPLQKPLGKQPPTWRAWPELIAAVACGAEPSLRAASLSLLDEAVTQADWSVWGRLARHQRARIRLLELAEAVRVAPGGQTKSAEWATVTMGRAETRGSGQGHPAWVFADGGWTHYPSHEYDHLYLRTPLTGNFEIDCEVTPFDWREIRVGYGGQAAGLKYDRKSHDLFEYGREKPSVPIPPPAFDKIGERLKLRLAVKDGFARTYVDGRMIHENRLPAEPEPWATIFAPVMNMGTVANLKISGDPKVPETVRLSTRPNLAGWLTDYYPETNFAERPLWRKAGDEIVGRKLDVSATPSREYDEYGNARVTNPEGFPGGKVEAVLKYNRPMLEDGEITYEFMYEPGQVHVHPALDRLTFLLDPDGVKIHWMTDGPWERTGLTPDNATVEPASRKGPAKLPLKPKTWNKVSLKTVGDRVELRLNGELVYDRTLEPTNRRDFGLFRYADETEARVRDVVMRGDWGKALPASLRAPAATAAK